MEKRISLLFLPVLSFFLSVFPAAALLFLNQGLEFGESFLLVFAVSSIL